MTGARTVLIVDNDGDVAEVVQALLTDEGYRVAVLFDIEADAVAAAVGKLEPDAALLDGSTHGTGYGSSWDVAALLARRERPVPVVMFTAHGGDLAEAREGASERSTAARFAGVVAKPFDADDLLVVIARAVGAAVEFDASATADAGRSTRLAADLERAGARDVRTSARREWVTFRTPRDRVVQLYWWHGGGSYLIGRYEEDGRKLQNIARTYERASAVEICASLIRAERLD